MSQENLLALVSLLLNLLLFVAKPHPQLPPLLYLLFFVAKPHHLPLLLLPLLYLLFFVA